MAERQSGQATGFMAFKDQPLIGVILQEKDREVVHYFANEADAASSSLAIQRVLGLFGAWSDLDWDEMEKELYRIRHESYPSPPISL